MPRRPNILLVTTDQQRPDTLGCHGATWARTPRLDALAAEGARFDRAYCANPLCTPSRVSIFTGQLPSRHGVWNIGCNTPSDAPFITYALAAAGYRTHHVGKAHWQANTAPAAQSVEALFDNPIYPGWRGPYHGFETVELAHGHPGYNLLAGHHACQVRSTLGHPLAGAPPAFGWRPRSARSFGGEAVDWDIPLSLHATVWTADRGIAFIEEHALRSDAPFFLHLGFQDPHHPHAVPTEFSPRTDPASVPLPRHEPGELDARPSHYRAAREGRLEQHPARGRHPVAGQNHGFDYRDLPERDIREARAYYQDLCNLIDRELGRVLDALERLGLADDTLVVFTSDHGELLGDHGLWMKGPFPYEEVLRVPLLLRWPRGLPAGRVVDDPASLLDLAPTLLAAAGIDCPDTPRDGVDWLPCLRGEASAPPRDHVIAEHTDDPEGLRFETIITREAKFTAWHGADLDFELTDAQDRPLHDPVLATRLARQLSRALPAAGLSPVPRLAYS